MQDWDTGFCIGTHSPCFVLCVLASFEAETFWRKLQEIIPCRTIQKRSVMCENKSVQMVQLPSLTECKAAFRQHMADPKWTFQCEAGGAAEDAADGRGESPGPTANSNEEPAARTKEEIAKEEWDAVIAGLSVSYGGASRRKAPSNVIQSNASHRDKHT